jgi:hypothetical protein
MLDDEFFATKPETLQYMGNPTPALDDAWNNLLDTGFNFRVPKDVAKKVNFTSIEIADGTGDLWATTAYKHNLHCIVRKNPPSNDQYKPAAKLKFPTSQKYLRQAHFPKAYPETWEIMKPLEDGSISLHADHCLEK